MGCVRVIRPAVVNITMPPFLDGVKEHRDKGHRHIEQYTTPDPRADG